MKTIDYDVSGILDRVIDRSGVAGEGNGDTVLDGAICKAQETTWSLPGILGQTRVATNFGHVPAHLIRVRDYLKTRDGKFLPVLRISEYKLDEEFLTLRPDARPVTIPKDAIQRRFPTHDIHMSPGQKISVASDSAQERLLHAAELSGSRKAFDRSLGMIAYFEFILPETTQICCEGVWTVAGTD